MLCIEKLLFDLQLHDDINRQTSTDVLSFVFLIAKNACIIVAVNKMDLVDFDESKFDRIRSDVEKLAAQANYKNQSIG